MITINAPVVNITVNVSGLAQTQFDTLNQGIQDIMGKAQIAIEKLDAVSATLDTVSAETTGLVEEVRALKEAAAEENISDELMAKIDALGAKATSIDGLVDTVAPNPTPTPADPDAGSGDGSTG